MDFIWILFAFICGLGMKLVSLPPLIGYLLAGFILHFAGVTPDAGDCVAQHRKIDISWHAEA